MSQDWTHKNVLERPTAAANLINECLATAVEMRTKTRQQQAEIERLEGVIRLAGRKLAACKEYANTGEDGHCMVNILLREAAEAKGE